ncbi:MAG: anthranilate phosphoribosyltransferase [Mangrovibacterium sp.]
MKETLEILFAGIELTEQQAYDSFMRITSGDLSDVEISAFLTAYNMRPVTVDEFRGFRKALLERCIPINFSDFDTIDVVGTGGDGKNTFNISTASCFVIAGAGYQVAKHGNYGLSSVSGASNMFEYFGYKFTNDADALRRDLEKNGICFLHAPLFHPAMKHVANVRKSLRVRTLFNYMGPVINPSAPKRQLIGCNSYAIMRLYNRLLRHEEGRFVTVHAVDGYDEVSLTCDTIAGTDCRLEVLQTKEFGFKSLKKEELAGGKSIDDAAKIFLSIMKNECTEAQRHVVIANAALGVQCFKPEQSLIDCVAEARQSLENGSTYRVFKQLLNN